MIRADKMGRIIYSRGKTLDFTKNTGIMGVINVTPDSFSDGGRFIEPEAAVELGHAMVEHGADILDIGGESTRPGSESISIQEEIDRIMPVVEKLVNSAVISVDTYKADVAEKALSAGVHMINDISAMQFDSRVADVVKEYDVSVILMHIKGTPKDMQVNPEYDDLIGEIKSYFKERIDYAENAGIRREKIIIDPGIGFGKTVAHNLSLIARIDNFFALGLPILVGHSRKAFIRKTVKSSLQKDISPDDPIVEIGTQAIVSALAMKGVHIIRVHNVANTAATLKVIEAIKKA